MKLSPTITAWWKRFSPSTFAWFIILDVILASILAGGLITSKIQRDQRIEKCAATCNYDYTKYTIKPKVGSYDICVLGCDVQD